MIDCVGILACFNCDRTISLDEPFEQVPGVTIAAGTLIQHTTCPPAPCDHCGVVRPYVDLTRIDLGDVNVLTCANGCISREARP